MEEYIETIRPDARQQAMTEVQSAMQQGKSYTVILPFDRTPLDKEPTWYSVSGIPIFNKDGQLVEYFGLSRNITSLMEAQEKLRVETARAEDSGRLKAAFLANMTHEIRTPLNAIVGFSDLLPMVEDAADKQEFMRIIRNNCDMLLRLINDILEASNIESRPLAIEPADVDFAQAFDDICQTLEQRVQEPGVQFIKENPYSTFNAYLDKGRIQQVITNFVTNAVKYTHQGHIKVGYRQEDKNLYIYCEDTGAGIPKEKQAMVFERFVKLNDFVQGTGLGLSICKSIAERCGGSIGVESDGEGTGSTFWIRIPFEKSEQPTVNQ
jgi:signal transduction histidine kinase